MKKPKIELAEEQQPRKILRADKAPTTGYSLVVDGHFKSHHDTVEAAEEAIRSGKERLDLMSFGDDLVLPLVSMTQSARRRMPQAAAG